MSSAGILHFVQNDISLIFKYHPGLFTSVIRAALIKEIAVAIKAKRLELWLGRVNLPFGRLLASLPDRRLEAASGC